MAYKSDKDRRAIRVVIGVFALILLALGVWANAHG